MKKVGKKLISYLLVFAMVISIFPMKSSAANPEYSSNGDEVPQFSAANAFDGDISTRWASVAELATEEDPRWIQVKYPSAKKVNNFKVEWERTNVDSFQILGSNDGTNFEEVYRSDVSITDFTSDIKLDQAVSYTYYRLNITKFRSEAPDRQGKSVDWPTVSVYEFTQEFVREAYRGSQNENLFLNKAAKANNVEERTKFFAKNAVDGDLKTRWSTDVSKAPYTLEVEFDKLTVIKSFVIDWERAEADQNVLAFNISVTENGSDYTEVYKQDKRVDEQSQTINFGEEVFATKVKLTVEAVDGGRLNWPNVGVNEFSAYSHEREVIQKTISSLKDLKKLAVNSDVTKLVLPTVEGGGILKVISSNADQVVDTKGNVYKPLNDRTVKVTVELTKDSKVTTKEVAVDVPGIYEDLGVGEIPKVVPEIQQWHGKEGKTVIDANTTISFAPEFSKAKDDYKEDLKARGLNLSEGESSKQITFVKVDDKGYGEEGYYIDIENGNIRIEAATNTGAFYASRTLLQIGEDLQNGEIKDYPKYKLRGMMLDTGRRFVPYNTLKDILKNLAYYKMNDLHLHLSDNYIWLADHGRDLEYVRENAEAGFRLESNIKSSDGRFSLTSEDHYTNEEFRAFVKAAKSYGINIIPEFDTPAHALAFIRVRPDLQYKGLVGTHNNVERVAMFDLANKDTLPFIKSVFEEQMEGENANFEGLDVIHFGADEYYGNNEQYRKYVSDMITYFRDEKGKTPRVWGSLSNKVGITPIDGEGAQMNIWSLGWNTETQALKDGFDIINITDSPTYIVPNGAGNRGAYGDYLNLGQVFNWAPNKFGNRQMDESHPKLLGGAFAIWNDTVDKRDTGITSYDVFARFIDALPTIAEKTWNSDLRQKTYDEHKNVVDDKVADGTYLDPSTNPFYKHDKLNIKVNKDKLSGYKNENVKVESGYLKFDGSGKLSKDIENLGPDYNIEVEVTLDDVDEKQILFTDGKTTFYLVNENGRIGYKFERYDIEYDYKPKAGDKLKLIISGEKQLTKLVVNDKDIDMVENPKRPAIANTTFVLPLKEIGTNSRMKLHSLNIKEGKYVDPAVIHPVEVKANSEEIENATSSEGRIDLAFDGNPATIWHSAWDGGQYPFIVDMKLDGSQKLAQFKYLPRLSGPNGVITEFDLQYSNDGGQTYKSFESGRWAEDNKAKTIDLNGLEATDLRLVITDSMSDNFKKFASSAEFIIKKVIEEEPEPEPEPEPVDKDALKQRLAEANVDEEKYTEESFEKLNQAKIRANEVIADEKASQEEVNEALANLDAAIKGLELKPEIGETTVEYEKVNIATPYEVKVIEDPEQAEGTERIGVKGENGVRQIVYKVVYDKYGNEVSRLVVSDSHLTLKVDEIIYKGTKKYTGWKNISGLWYYYENGEAVKSSWRFLMVKTPEGIQRRNWKYFNKNGENIIKFYQEKGNTHLSLVGPYRDYAKGWYKLGRAWTYYKGSWGVRAENEWRNFSVQLANGDIKVVKKYFNKNGYSVSSLYRENGRAYYSLSGPDTYLYYGWKTIGNGKLYFLNPSGRAAVGELEIGGRTYKFTSRGYLVK